MVLTEQTAGQGGARGLRIAATVVRGRGGSIGVQMMIGNFTEQPLIQWAVQFNKNPFGLAPNGPLQVGEVMPHGGTAQTLLPIAAGNPELVAPTPPTLPLYLEVAIKTNIDVFYLSIGYDLSAVLVDAGPVSQDVFRDTWTNAPPNAKMRSMGRLSAQVTPDMLTQRMKQYYCYLVKQMDDVMYFSATTANQLTVFCEIMLQQSGPGIQLQCCCPQAWQLVALFQSYMSEVLKVQWQGGAGS